MRNRIGIRREDKNEWERRVPLTPSDVAELVGVGVRVAVEPFARRAFPDREYAEAGAEILADVRPCELVLGIKEMPVDYFRQGGAYVFFSHTIKGQPYNMKMLARLVEQRCTLIDYELVTDEQARRLIFFGRFAGVAGMLDTLWTLGRRLEALSTPNPFSGLEPAHRYGDLDRAKAATREVARQIETEGVPAALAPLVFGFTGYGNVSRGAQEILDLLPHVAVDPAELGAFVRRNGTLRNKVVKVVYEEDDLVERIDAGRPFELQEYYDHPDRYRSIFEPHLEWLSVIVNGIVWAERYPRLADADQLEALFARSDRPKLLVVGDITCDVGGSLACTVRDTHSGDPVYVYDAGTRQAVSGFAGPGLAVMAVGNLPTELPRESSVAFGSALRPFVPEIADVDLSASFEAASLPEPIRRAVILWRGRFTPDHAYMRDFLR